MTQSEYDDPSAWTGGRTAPSESYDSDDDTQSSLDSAALQREWEEQLEQMKLMFQIIIFPFVGKFFGRKFGYYRKSTPTTQDF